jgi:hypothetical protein
VVRVKRSKIMVPKDAQVRSLANKINTFIRIGSVSDDVTEAVDLVHASLVDDSKRPSERLKV